MKNRLVFPSNETDETLYVWNKYNLVNKKYIWEKYSLENGYNYTWDKYNARYKQGSVYYNLSEKTYRYKKLQPINNINNANSYTQSNQFVNIHKYKVKSKFINRWYKTDRYGNIRLLMDRNDLTEYTVNSIAFVTTMRLWKRDLTYVDIDSTDFKNNENYLSIPYLLSIGYIGVSHINSDAYELPKTKPMFYFTNDSYFSVIQTGSPYGEIPQLHNSTSFVDYNNENGLDTAGWAEYEAANLYECNIYTSSSSNYTNQYVLSALAPRELLTSRYWKDYWHSIDEIEGLENVVSGQVDSYNFYNLKDESVRILMPNDYGYMYSTYKLTLYDDTGKEVQDAGWSDATSTPTAYCEYVGTVPREESYYWKAGQYTSSSTFTATFTKAPLNNIGYGYQYSLRYGCFDDDNTFAATYGNNLQVDGNQDKYRITRGTFIETINDTTNYYPEYGVQGKYFYILRDKTPVIKKGKYLGTVEAIDNIYPTDGTQDGYWYVFKEVYESETPMKGQFIAQIESPNSNAYPTNGAYDGNWYEYVKSYGLSKLRITDANIMGAVDYNANINPQEDYSIGNVASAEISFKYYNIKNDIQQYIDAGECDYYTFNNETLGWEKVGKFYLEEVIEDRTIIDIKAYDGIIKTEKYIDDFIEETTFPIALSDFYINLCNYLGLEGVVAENIVNADMVINDNFEAVNISGRQVLQYIAEAAGGFIKANEEGQLVLRDYETKHININNSKYTKLLKNNYQTEPIEGVIVKKSDSDLGTPAGATSGNIYIIENNPLFYADTQSEIYSYVNNIYNHINQRVYIPAEIELLQDFGINCGDIITVNDNVFYVMEKSTSASGCKFKCRGNKKREIQTNNLNSEIIALRGKTNELTRDLDKTQSTLTDMSRDLSSQITQTAESFTSQIRQQDEVITEIRQDLNGIDLVYNSENGTASITIGDVTVTDLVNGEYVTRTVAGIDLTGYVTFHSLETAGATTINGSNITTGTISADRINMTGAITWSDLSSGVQDIIDANSGGGTVDGLPDYLKSTYIDATTILSPTIEGGSLTSTLISGGNIHSTVIEDSKIDFQIKEGSFSYSAGYIDAYVNDTGSPSSARTGLRIVAPWNGDGYTGGLTLDANRGMVLKAGQDIFFYLPNRNPVALSTILDKLGL